MLLDCLFVAPSGDIDCLRGLVTLRGMKTPVVISEKQAMWKGTKSGSLAAYLVHAISSTFCSIVFNPTSTHPPMHASVLSLSAPFRRMPVS